jgi:uncharacterized membrane protein
MAAETASFRGHIFLKKISVVMISSTHLHAMIVHFPIALLLVGFLADVLALFSPRSFFRQAALSLLVLGTAGVVAAFFSGNAAGEGMEEGSLGQAMSLHAQAAQITLWLSLSAALFRVGAMLLKQNCRWARVISFVLVTLSAVAVSRTGYLGGQLVFKHAAGVELSLE